MDNLIAFFRLYALVGLALSLAVHLAALSGLAPVNDGAFFALHVGIFPLWLFVILTLNRMFGAGGLRRNDLWKVALSLCPPWVKYMTYGFFAYAAINFLWFVLHSPPHGAHAAAPPASVLRGFSGHWMAFYSAGFAVLTGAASVGWDRLRRQCPQGHAVGWSDGFCPACGAKLPNPNLR